MAVRARLSASCINACQAISCRGVYCLALVAAALLICSSAFAVQAAGGDAGVRAGRTDIAVRVSNTVAVLGAFHAGMRAVVAVRGKRGRRAVSVSKTACAAGGALVDGRAVSEPAAFYCAREYLCPVGVIAGAVADCACVVWIG
jgi:hypothetical protein